MSAPAITDDLAGLCQRLVDAAPHDAIYVLDRDGTVLSWNPAAARLFGYGADEIVGMSARALYPAELLAAGHPHRDCDIAERLGFHEDDSWRVGKDGQRIWVHVVTSALRDPDGNLAGFGTVTRELSRPHETETTYRAMVRCAPLGIFHADNKGRILHANPRSNLIFGTRDDEALGLGWVANVHPEDLDFLEAALGGANDTRTECRHEFRLLMPDASTRWLRCRTAPLLSTFGEFLGTVGTLEDITAQRATETQLVQAQKMQAIGRLAGGIAHDFNNVLVSIVCSAEFLQADLPVGDSRRADVDEILSGARRAANLTRQLLAIGRKQMLAPSALELNSVVTETESLLRPLLGEAIHVMTLPAPTPVLVYADRAQIEQVLMNLAVNARDAMPEGGTFTFEISTQAAETTTNGWGIVRVSDTGIGMTAEVLAHAFEPFFTTKGVGLGAGLGLSTVDGIIRQSGGTITAASEPGEGTTLTIRLPLVERLSPSHGVPAIISAMNAAQVLGAPTTHVTPPGSHAGVEGTAGTVLIVEDEAAVRAIARRVLVRQGYHVLTARHGGDALRTLTTFKGPIDLLITDVVMPEMGGLELAAQVAQRFPSLRVVLMSGYADLELDARETKGIVSGFLQKPFTATSLLTAVRTVAGERART